MKKAIIAIGGGDIRKKATATIDEQIIELTGKTKPNLLFIPTASNDDERYWQSINDYFSGYWSCKTDVLCLIKETPYQADMEKKISWADIIYVGGGNTLKMMRRWRHLGVDTLLKKAYNNGTVMCGVSAGSICWFEFGHSDSMSSYDPDNWEYIKVRGLGLIKGINCPHYDSATLDVPRRQDFQAMIKKEGGMGLAVDDNCALEIIDGTHFRVLTSREGAGAYRVCKRGGRVVEEKIEQTVELRLLKELYNK